MNSSFLFLGQMCLAVLALMASVSLLLQFGFPRDTLRSLGLTFLFSLALMLGVDAATWWGFFAVFHYEPIYGVLVGIMGFAWPAFIWLGVLDQPTQIQRKVMWRLPILGGLIGHALGAGVTIYLFGIGWIASLVVVLCYASSQRFVLRILFAQIIVSVIYGVLLRSGIFWGAQLCFAVWIVFTHRIVNAFLVKNHIRNSLGAAT